MSKPIVLKLFWGQGLQCCAHQCETPLLIHAHCCLMDGDFLYTLMPQGEQYMLHSLCVCHAPQGEEFQYRIPFQLMPYSIRLNS